MTLSWFCFLADVTLFEQKQKFFSNFNSSGPGSSGIDPSGIYPFGPETSGIDPFGPESSGPESSGLNSSGSFAASGVFQSSHALSTNNWSVHILHALYQKFPHEVEFGADFFSQFQNATFNFTEMVDLMQNFTSNDDEVCMGMQQVYSCLAFLTIQRFELFCFSGLKQFF